LQSGGGGLVEQCTLHLRSDGLSTVKKLPIAPAARSLTKRKRVWIHEVGMWAENSGSEQAGKVVDFGGMAMQCPCRMILGPWDAIC
jgi:hypothetical protein